MKKISMLVLLIIVMSWIIYGFIFSSSPEPKNNFKADISEGSVVQGVNGSTESVETKLTESNESRLKAKTIDTEKPKPEPEKNLSGIDLKIDGNMLEESYLAESNSDFGWKSYWQNELYVILMESSRSYPFMSQATDCRELTCRVEVEVSTQQLHFIKQTVVAIDAEFSRRQMPLAINSIDVKEGAIVFYVQPGDMPR